MSRRTLSVIAPLVVAALSIAGCGFTEMHEVALRPPSEPTAQRIEVYVGTQRPPRPFFEVSLLQAVGHGSDANLADVIKALSTRAAMLGCDAIVRVQVEQGYSMAHGFAVCAKWAAAPASSPLVVPLPSDPAAPPPATEPAPQPQPATSEGTSL